MKKFRIPLALLAVVLVFVLGFTLTREKTGTDTLLPPEEGIYVLSLLVGGNGQGQSAHGDLL